MAKLTTLFTTSVGKKQLVGLTGLAVSLFALTHMAGNMLILVGSDAYNKYAHALEVNPLLPVAEIGLVVMFLVHFGLTIQLAISNKKARPVPNYRAPNSEGKRARLASRTMILSGLLILAFLILHLITFKYGTHYVTNVGGIEMRDLYRLVVEKFHEPFYVIWYEICLLILGAHLSHGFAACFQSLGLASVRNPLLKKVAWAFAIVVAGGFISQPLYIVLCGAR